MQDATQDAIQWREEFWPLVDVKIWILGAISDVTHVAGPTRVLNSKLWGQTVEFKCDDESVIFKGCKLALFAKRTATEMLLSRCCSEHVPELLARKVLPNQESWTLHAAFDGTEVEQTRNFENILKMARTLAKIQTLVAQHSSADKAKLPQMPIEQIPAMLDFMIERIANGYLEAWLANDAALLNAYGLPIDVLEQVKCFRPLVAQWTQELLDGKWPISIDHVDFNVSNAAVQDDGTILIYDWEEAVISSPFFSIDRLLDDADSFEEHPQRIPQDQGLLYLTPNQMAIRNAYIDALPWHTRSQRERAFDLAMSLAPIKTAYEGEPFNKALGRENGFPEYAACCFGRALPRWQALSTRSG